MPHPLVEADARANLCFHDIGQDDSVIYTVPMAYLTAVAEGVRALGVSDRVRVYFDDGYASAITAVDALRSGYPEIEVVLALTLAFIDQPGFISWPDVPELHRAGAAIAGHGQEHLHMEELTDEQVLHQLTSSRDAFAGYGAYEFVFPYGTYSDAVLAVNERHQLFSVLTTVDYGWDRGQSLRPRLMVTSELTPADVCARLASPE